MRRLLLLVVPLAVLAGCGGDDGFPWPDALSSNATEHAAENGMFLASQIHDGVATIAPFAAFPDTCGTFSGVLVGGVPKDSDADGIPDDATLTFSHEACFQADYFYDGSIRMKDPGAAPGFDYTADYTVTYNSGNAAYRWKQSRQIRFNGATTTGTVSHREWLFDPAAPGDGQEELGVAGSFTLTKTGGGVLAPGAWGPANLTFTGWIDHKDTRAPAGSDWRFAVSTPTPLVTDGVCETDGGIVDGDVAGIVNGHGAVSFLRSWNGCGVETTSVEGTTD